MDKLITRIIMLAVLIIMLAETRVHGQVNIELHGGIGYSGVDMEAWSGTEPEDWGQFMSEVYATVYPLKLGGISLGAEFGYQYFFWYTTDVPGYSWVYEYNVDAFRLMILMRANLLSNLFVELGPGAFMFGDWTDFGLTASAGYRIGLTEHIAIPVKLRTEIILDRDANLFPVGLSAGFSYTF